MIVLFYLGGKCAHCLQQLQDFGKEFEAFRTIGADVVAIGTDPADDARSLKSNAEGIAIPMPVLADPSLAAFRAYRSFDDFEGRPIHGTFLIDPRGCILWHRASADPFLDVAFLESEVRRIGGPRP